MRSKHSDAFISDCVEKYRAKVPVSQICRETGISQSVMFRAIKKAGVPGIRLLDLPKQDIIAAYIAGDSPSIIGHRYGISDPPIMRILREAGITLRSGSEANILRAKRLTPEERRQNAAAAHAAKRGRPNTMEALERAAMTRQVKMTGRMSRTETALAGMLRERGIDSIPQVAIGPYNCDIGAAPVAVEVFGGKWHWHGAHIARSPQRIRHILDAGWHMLAVRIAPVGDPLTASTADYIAAYIKQASSDPAAVRQYRVVRSNGDLIAAGSAQDDDFSIVSAFKNARDATTGRYVRVPK